MPDMRLDRRSFFATLAALIAPKPAMGRQCRAVDRLSPLVYNELYLNQVLARLRGMEMPVPQRGDTITVRLPAYLKGKGSLFNPHENIAAKYPAMQAKVIEALRSEFTNKRNTR